MTERLLRKMGKPHLVLQILKKEDAIILIGAILLKKWQLLNESSVESARKFHVILKRKKENIVIPCPCVWELAFTSIIWTKA